MDSYAEKSIEAQIFYGGESAVVLSRKDELFHVYFEGFCVGRFNTIVSADCRLRDLGDLRGT